MLLIRHIYWALAIAYFEWALREIEPTHKDVPFIVLRLRELKEQQRSAYESHWATRTAASGS